MKVLVINSGSSSIKFQLFEMPAGDVLVSGLLEKIGEGTSNLKYERFVPVHEETKIEEPVENHHRGLEKIIDMLTSAEHGVIKNADEIKAVGHRVVHGGEDFHAPTVVDDNVLDAIRKNIPLAPLHNPANLTGIEVAAELFPKAPQVAVFDTAFHQTIPAYAFRYALPDEWYQEHKVRRYGFHGTSHHYVAKAAAKHFGKDLKDLNVITIHLGNGASMAAVKNGESVDTTMGLTPLEGVIMGTRCGDIDPAIHFFLARELKMSFDEIDTTMNKKSGLKGLCGMNDMRDIFAAKDKGDQKAALALDMYNYRIKKYIGAYAAILGRLDAIIFTAGVGENAAPVRSGACSDLGIIGIELNEEKNAERAPGIREIQSDSSKVKVLIVPTNEELEIAQQAETVL